MDSKKLSKEEIRKSLKETIRKYERLLKAFEVYDKTGKITEGLKVLKGVK